MRRRGCLLALLALIAGAALAPSAHADGDPGSDVLAYQSLFLPADAGLSVNQQVQLGNLLHTASRSRFGLRVAVIASRTDLGAVTGLWQKPRGYARFLGLELSLAYKGRLLVVMPNGFGFHWPGHPDAPAYRALGHVRIGPGPAGLGAATQGAVRALAKADGINLGSTGGSPSDTSPGSGAGSTAAGSTDARTAVIFAIVLALASAAAAAILLRRRRGRWAPRVSRRARHALRGRSLRLGLSFAALLTFAVALIAVAVDLVGSSKPAQGDALAANPVLDPGTPLSTPAPDFTLTNEFGRPVSLHSLRGKVVILAFNDSECTTICPLTTSAMLDARAMLGASGSQVQLLGVDANPKATAIEDVLSYSQLHGLLHRWQFLTGSAAQLRSVWKAYSIGVQITQRQVDHSPAVFVIDPRGRLAKLYVTQPSYAAVGQFGQVLAQEASTLLPGHPRVNSNLSYSHIAGLTPADSVTLPRAGGGSVPLGPGHSRLLLFFATWNRQTTGLAGRLNALNGYQSVTAARGLPRLTAVDEASVEASPSALSRFLAGLPKPLRYPVAVDHSGRVADGYEVQGEPWFVLTSPAGRILWYWQVSASGWPTTDALIHQVRNALARVPKNSAGTASPGRQLAGSPSALAALHQQAARVLGSLPALTQRIRALRGYPIVLNAWASWCAPCRSEFGLLASASSRYGRRVAFLGADTDDSSGDAQAFLAQHPVSYPSYQATTTGLRSLLPQGVLGLPTTIFIDRAGKVTFVHTGQYDSQGSLDGDITGYALGR